MPPRFKLPMAGNGSHRSSRYWQDLSAGPGRGCSDWHHADVINQSGIDISRAFFDELVRPIVAAHVPENSFAAGRVGGGSDALGLDDETSRDHDWGLRLSLFVAADEQAEDVVAALDDELPQAFRGLPTRFAFTGETAARHHVDVATVAASPCQHWDSIHAARSPPLIGSRSPGRQSWKSPPARSSSTATGNYFALEMRCRGTPTTSGGTSLHATGHGFPRRCR